MNDFACQFQAQSIQLLNFDETTPITTVTLHEDTTTQTSLAIVRCVDGATPPVVIEDCVCNLVRTIPANGPFDVWKLNNNNNNNNQVNINVNEKDFKAYFVGTAQATSTIDYDTQRTHLIIARCASPTTPFTASVTIEVDILPNQQPVISNYPSASSQPLTANQANPIGTTVYTVTANDPEGDALTYTMTQSPDRNWLTIGASNGIIRTAVDTRVITSESIVCTVTVSDGHDNTVNNFIVTVRFQNLNSRPYITNLPSSINVTEDQIGGFDLGRTLTYGDDTPQTNQAALEPDCSVDPVSESYKFTYETGTRKIKLNTITTGQTLLDFETTDKYLITCVVFDGYLYSEGDVLTMHVNNVNEAPVFNAATYYCTLAESNAGVSTCDLNLVVTDPEQNAIPTLELLQGNNSDRFRYDRTNDKLTFTVDYDVDNNNFPTSQIISIYAVDISRASSTAKIEIKIQDANDNTCDFGQFQAAQFTIDQGTTLTTLGSFAASDADLTSPNNVVTYETFAGVPSNAVNYLTVFGNGEIKYTGLIPESEHGKSYSLLVRCKDGGSPARSATGTVQVSYLITTSTTTTTTTTTEKRTFDDEAIVAVFATLISLLALGLLIALWYFCCRGGQNMCIPPQQAPPSYGYNQYPPQRQPYQRPRFTPPRQVRPAEEYVYEETIEPPPPPQRGPPPPRPYYDDRPPPFDNGDDFFRTSGGSRGSSNFVDHAWRDGDHYEDGLGYDGRPVSKSDIFLTGNRQRALPPPVGRNEGYY
ncbi:cadherin-related family member 1a-like [Littorina saxatilis]|uniref:cadherin-related family member 1a-like n=1 Tax=Littorina saxatilis TaxID=31220 RepID=UPI0038B66C40